MFLTNKMHGLVLIVLISVVLHACDSKPTKTRETSKQIELAKEVYETVISNDNSSADFNIKIEFPVVKTKDSTLVNTIIRQEATRRINKSTLSDSVFSNPNLVAQELELAYEKFCEDFPEINAEWYFTRSVNVISRTEKYMSIEFYENSFLGGSHSNELHLYSTYRIKDGSKMTLSRVLSDPEYDNALALAETKFLIQKGLKKEDDLKANGWFFPNGKFTMTNNFYITDSTLVLFYNQYDIGSYAAGTTKLVLNLNQIKFKQS